MILELVQNVALVVALGVAIQAVQRRWGLHTLVARLFSGGLFAFVTIVAMLTPFRLAPGLIFDSRSIILCSAGLVGGPLVAGIAAVAAIAYRAYLGGAGATVGILVIVESAALGTLFFYLRRRDKRFGTAPGLYLLGLLVHAAMVGLLLALPSALRELSLREIAVPVLLLYPLATAALCMLLLQHEERFADQESLKLSEKRLKEMNARLERTALGVITTLGRVVEVRDPYTQGHEVGVARLATMIAADLELSDEVIREIEVAALVHDIGKISVPAEILHKPGALSEVEFDLMKCHPRVGYELLQHIDFEWPIAEYVLQHHERMDGSGYPEGLMGDQIPIQARILAVADVIEATGSHRPYRPALGLDAALQELVQNPEKYDGRVVAACLSLYKDGRLSLE
jgi:hypothetical protein